MRLLPAVSSLSFALSLGFGVDVARADAVPPAPDDCPPGRVGVTSHSGPECVLEAPDDCAPGYRGQLRGTCVLATCSGDSGCKEGERCLKVDTCQEFRELHWTGWGWSAQRPTPAGNLLAEPPSPPPPGPPKKAWVQLKICGQDGSCEAPAECRTAALCYPETAIGKTKAKVNQPGSEVPAPDDDPDDPASKHDTVVDPSGYQPGRTSPGQDAHPNTDSGGCRKGCTTASTTAQDTMVGAGLWLALALMVRRRLKRS